MNNNFQNEIVWIYYLYFLVYVHVCGAGVEARGELVGVSFLSSTTWVLGPKLRSLDLAACTFTYWAILSGPIQLIKRYLDKIFSNIILYSFLCFFILLMCPTLASKLFYSWDWLWIQDPLASVSRILDLQLRDATLSQKIILILKRRIQWHNLVENFIQACYAFLYGVYKAPLK